MPNSANVRLDDMSPWQKNGRAVVLYKSLKTYKEVVEYTVEEDLAGGDKTDSGAADNAGAVVEIINSLPDDLKKKNFTDTSVGGNDAFNAYWAYNEDDDIVPDLNSSSVPSSGLGRVYYKNIEQYQRILWMRFGVPEYVGLTDFYLGNADTNLATLMNSGLNIGGILGHLLGSAIGFAFKMPFLPLIWMNRIVNSANVTASTRYYHFRNTMPLYLRMVNVIMSHLAVGMGLYPGGGITGGVNEGNNKDLYASTGLPEVLENGPDIFTIMDKRSRRSGVNREIRTTDQFTDMMNEPSWFEKFFRSIAHSSIGGHDFIGFRIEKSTDSSESFSNSLGESNIQAKLNGKAGEIRSKAFDTQGGNTGIGLIDNVKDFTVNLFKSAANSVGLGQLMNTVSGQGFYDIGEVWKSSSFTKSYNFNIKLRSRYGDPVSIYQSIYIPLSLLLAAGSPRSIGSNMYTSPFIINAYCKGMFAVPTGMIESLTITRGASEFGWSNVELPTAVDVSMTIKDMSPVMHLSLADSGFLDVFKQNTNMHEYLTTLSGVGLMERYFRMSSMKRKGAAALLIKKNTWGSPLYWGNAIGSSNVAKILTSVLPFSKVPTN